MTLTQPARYRTFVLLLLFIGLSVVGPLATQPVLAREAPAEAGDAVETPRATSVVDLLSLSSVNDSRLSPDGSHFAYVKETAVSDWVNQTGSE